MDTLIRKFIHLQKDMDEKAYLASMIAYSIAPTLVRRKPSSLVTFTKSNRNLYDLWDRYKEDIDQELNMEYIEIRRTKGSILVLFYNPKQLHAFLRARKNRSFLENCGYTRLESLNESLELLKLRFAGGCPHEIGIFLGIPVEDVIGFIESNGKECLLCKYWKVYSNPERARYLFDLFDKARNHVICEILACGGGCAFPKLLLCS